VQLYTGTDVHKALKKGWLMCNKLGGKNWKWPQDNPSTFPAQSDLENAR